MEHKKSFTKHKKLSLISECKTEYSSITNLMLKKDVRIKFGTTIGTIFTLVAIFFSITIFFFGSDKRLLTFSYNGEIANVYSINLPMFYIFLFILSVINLLLIFSIFKETEAMIIKLIYSDLRWFFVLKQFLLGFPFLIGLFFKRNNISLICSISFNILILILIVFYYKAVKEKKNMTLYAFINIYTYTSVVFSFVIYITFYNISEILINSLNDNESLKIETKDIVNILFISSHSIYCIISVILITYFKDVIFSLTFLYFMTGYLVNPSLLSKEELTTTIVLLTFSAISVLITLVKYGKVTFGFEDTQNVDEILVYRAEHKRSSWFDQSQN